MKACLYPVWFENLMVCSLVHSPCASDGSGVTTARYSRES
jgi:hypothetical protein